MASKSEPPLRNKEEGLGLIPFFLLPFTITPLDFFFPCLLIPPPISCLGKSVIIASQIFKDYEPQTVKAFSLQPQHFLAPMEVYDCLRVAGTRRNMDSVSNGVLPGGTCVNFCIRLDVR